MIATESDTVFRWRRRDKAARPGDRPPVSSTTEHADAIRTRSTRSSAQGRLSGADDIIEMLSAYAGSSPARSTRSPRWVRDPQLRSCGMLVEHFDERLGCDA